MNIKIIIAFLLTITVTTISAQEIKLTNAEVAKFKSGLSKSGRLKTVEADFVQYKKVGQVKKEMTSSGKFYVKNPDKLAWKYSAPMKYSMIFKDKKVYIDNKGKKQSMDLSRNKQFEKISEAIQSSTASAGYSSKEFTSTYYQEGSAYILKLDPLTKDLKKAMKQIVLYFDKSNYQLEELKLIESNKGYTRFVLSNQKVNTNLSDSVFDL